MSNPYPKCRRCEKRKKQRHITHTTFMAGYYHATVSVTSIDLCASCKDYLLGLALAVIFEDAK